MLMVALLVHPCWLPLRIVLMLMREDVCPNPLDHGGKIEAVGQKTRGLLCIEGYRGMFLRNERLEWRK